MGTKTDVEFANFFIFNSLYGPKEGEEEKKLLFYIPHSDSVNTKFRNVGLVEGIRQFTSTFKPNEPLSSLHTQKTRQLYYSPEENFLMVLTLKIPTITQLKDGINHCDFLEDDLQDNVYEAVLKQSYLMYRLFNNTFDLTVKNSGVNVLKQKMDKFFTTYLKGINWAHCDLLNVFNGMQYLPLDRQTFLEVQCFVNSLECNYPQVKFTAVFYNDHIIWSGLDPDDMQAVYQYLIGTIVPASVESELQVVSKPRVPPFGILHHGRFITAFGNSDKGEKKIPQIYTFSHTPSTYFMLLYRIFSATICLFIDASSIITSQMMKNLDNFMNPKLTCLVTNIGEYCHKLQNVIATSIPDTAPRFIYFNKFNYAYKSSVHLDNKQTGNIACPKDSMKVMIDMNARKKHLGNFGEIIVKTTNDYWVVGKSSNSREFYIALQQKNANVSEISDEIQKICDTELKGIFFQTV